MGDSTNGLHLSGILISALLLAAWMLQSPPLSPSRPSHGDQLRDHVNSFEDVPARLWQDPFDTVHRFRDKRDSEEQQIQTEINGQSQLILKVTPSGSSDQQRRHLQTEINGQSQLILKVTPSGSSDQQRSDQDLATYIKQSLTKGSRLTVLPVMVDTSPYAEAKEHRLRRRAAVIAALTSRGVVPVDGSHIGYWFVKEEGKGIPSTIVPYELYRGRRQGVLVLWLPAAHFNHEPIRRLADLVGKIRCESLLGHDSKLKCGNLTLIGPPSSDTLAKMASEAVKFTSDNEQRTAVEQLRDLELFSATATAPACRLLGEDELDSCRTQPDEIVCMEKKLEDKLASIGIRLVRTIVTDDRIARALVSELALRGVDPACATDRSFPHPRCRDHRDDPYQGYRDHIVLISEADTGFGRSLPKLINDEITRKIRQIPPEHADKYKTSDLPWIHRYGYLRGVDGELAKTGKEPEKPKLNNLQGLAQLDAMAMEPARGSSQLDYLRRLADRIQDLDHELRQKEQGRIRAIGILGNDLYDKLLILQAMREHFPNMVFFTNDIDARYLDPKDYRWTRNLIIASSFGLELDSKWQAKVPPLRGVYQTSVFLSAQLALSLKGEKRNSQVLRKYLSPRVFEVGRGRFIDLSKPVAPSGSLQINKSYAEEVKGFYPLPHRAPSLPPHWYWIAVIAGIALLLAFFTITPLREILCRWEKQHWIFAIGFMTITLMTLYSAYIFMIQQDEPFVWAAGVSMWPAELIRILCFLFSALFLVLAWQRLKLDDDKLAKRFMLPRIVENKGKGESHGEKDETNSEVKNCHQTSSGYCKRAFEMFFWYEQQEETKEPQSVVDIWKAYKEHGRLSHRFLRALFMFVLLWVIAWIALIFVQPMQIPYRGIETYYFSFWFGMVPLAITFGLLLFGVMDESRLCSTLIRHISQSKQDWPGIEQKIEDQLKALNSKESSTGEEDHNEKDDNVSRDNLIELERKRVTVDFIADRTRPSGDLIWFPFIILILILISLSTRFDNFDTKTAVLGLLSAAIAIALSSAYVLRRSANYTKKEIVSQLRDRMLSQKTAEAKSEPDQVELMIKQIEEIHQGAFRPWYQQPLVRALVWVGSMAAVIITEYVVVSG